MNDSIESVAINTQQLFDFLSGYLAVSQMSKPLKAYNVCSPEKQNLSPGKQNLSSPAGSEKTSGWSRAVVGRRFLGMESSVQRLAVNVLTSVVLCKLSGGVQSASSRRGEITSATRRLLLLLQLC